MGDVPAWSAGAVYVHTWVSHLCMHKRVEGLCAWEMSKCGDGGRPHALDRAGHNGDGDKVEYDDEDEESCPLQDEAEYNDEDKEPCPQCLHNPTHAQGEGGDVFV